MTGRRPVAGMPVQLAFDGGRPWPGAAEAAGIDAPLKIPFVFDTALARPACALLQAALGGSSSAVADFDSDTWLVYPTDNMTRIALTRPQLAKLATLVNRHWAAGTMDELITIFARLPQNG